MLNWTCSHWQHKCLLLTHWGCQHQKADARAGRMAQCKQQTTHALLASVDVVSQTMEYYWITKRNEALSCAKLWMKDNSDCPRDILLSVRSQTLWVIHTEYPELAILWQKIKMGCAGQGRGGGGNWKPNGLRKCSKVDRIILECTENNELYL